jgi:16S rRNA processing protein RimM
VVGVLLAWTSSTSTVVADGATPWGDGRMSAVEQVTVGRVGRPHGVRGEVSVELRTDEPERRFHQGARLTVRAPRAGAPLPDPVTVTRTRWHQGRLLVDFAEVPDRDVAEAMRGALLLVEVDPRERPEDPEEFYDHQLVGLAVHALEVDSPVGVVTQVRHSGAQDLLVVRRDDGREVLVPFVAELVPAVDLAGGHVTVADRPGLLDPED